ncbi:ATP-binding protein [Amphiplicatus metriothermophilus]|uniref:Geranyl-CoA carboxylase alpha subunit n=1 Tax=Amphiplicatus metriothermophilus TaxID=1519374 RepID=A0A239PQN5_9PROT|nr:biotin carboxylase N-terminal domain-containing protein [Amphiplicatus metriothermophilus]MBB5518486.1 geranyl-CoA carboxylase alpha subunit [Amphiplicatus metriothermophilus]SNT72353.1 geranyl-CoA carboxylase alpha subunit [Amphiplicatus metriothermophilus]
MLKPIRALLIANRGEIACRIIRTAKARGIRAVAVYSAADEDALHVKRADEAIFIGPPAPAQSYLDIEAIIAAAKKVGADAIHPGYGFLSERAAFAEACEKAGIAFVGPPASAIAAMGDKAEARRRMSAAGVPCAPGYDGADQSPARFRTEADKIGYPVMVKAAAGGGGRGMRVVQGPEELEDALAGARKEAESAFGDGRLLLEKLVVGARHVEIQVLADAHGNAVHLGERDCSLQRRRQKVIEEAPSPVVGPETRAAMGAAAVEAARAVGYRNAGTVEFLFEPSTQSFYFLEMNTRLQVEHPVTELVTGLDLVALQLDIAEGCPLPFGQEDVRLDGWAIEARLYAEDPAKGFLPQTGRLACFDLPSCDGGPTARREASSDSNAFLRVDAGVEAGDAVSPHYDPLIAKLVAHGRTRDEARLRLAAALDDAVILGVTTNAPFLAGLLRDEAFAKGEADVGYIERALDRLAPAPAPVSALDIALAAATLADWRLDDPLAGWNSRGPTAFPLKLQHGDEIIEARAIIDGPRVTGFLGDGQASVEALAIEDGRIRYRVDGAVRCARFAREGARLHLKGAGPARTFADMTHAPAGAQAGGGNEVRAPMAGVVASVLVKPGDAVKKGQTLIAVEAMKMEHRLAAPRDGVVETLSASVGDQVAIRAVLARLAPAQD